MLIMIEIAVEFKKIKIINQINYFSRHIETNYPKNCIYDFCTN